ncbi:MAG: type II toxin-antitoxin system MqsR family toxin [Eubacteriales bacterium]
MSRRKKNKPRKHYQLNHYSLSVVEQRINDGMYLIKENAKQGAYQDFGWDTSDIKKFYRKLKPRHFHKTDSSKCKLGVIIDAYKAHIYGEDVYTHFYIEEGLLVINGFHRQ